MRNVSIASERRSLSFRRLTGERRVAEERRKTIKNPVVEEPLQHKRLHTIIGVTGSLVTIAFALTVFKMTGLWDGMESAVTQLCFGSAMSFLYVFAFMRGFFSSG